MQNLYVQKLKIEMRNVYSQFGPTYGSDRKMIILPVHSTIYLQYYHKFTV